MPYRNAKIYSDGSHYIAIPQTNNSNKKKKSLVKGVCEGKVTQALNGKTENKKSATEALTPKERFERLYKENNGKKKAEKIKTIMQEMKSEFENEEGMKEFVERNMQRMERNKILRKMRLARKLNLNQWNWFCTFTYDDKLHTEESFRKKLSNILKKLVHRKGWRYIGVWERSPEKRRLHFHGIFYIPENAMTGELEEVSDYNTKTHTMQIIKQNSYFKERFGRNDFKPLNVKQEVYDSARYLMKYIEKSGEKLVFSRNIPTYFRSDVMDEDVLCTMGLNDGKLLLADDFTCWDEGCLVGKVSPEVISQMPKCN